MPVYIARFGALGPCKIGHSNEVHKRLDYIRARLWDDLRLIRLLAGTPDDERALHRRFRHLHIRFEWFQYSDALMGDLGLPDLQSDPTQAITQGRGQRGRALQQWMTAQGHTEQSLANLLKVTPSTVASWLKFGNFPRTKAADLIELSNGVLWDAYGTPPLRWNQKSPSEPLPGAPSTDPPDSIRRPLLGRVPLQSAVPGLDPHRHAVDHEMDLKAVAGRILSDEGAVRAGQDDLHGGDLKPEGTIFANLRAA